MSQAEEVCLYSHSSLLELTIQGTGTTVCFIHCLLSLFTPPTPDLVRKGLPSTGSEPTMKDLLTWKILSFPLSPHLPDQAVDHLNMKYRNTIFYLHFRKREGDVQSLLHVCHLSLGFFTFCLKEKKKNQENERGSSPPSKFVIWWWVWYVMGTLFWCVCMCSSYPLHPLEQTNRSEKALLEKAACVRRVCRSLWRTAVP